MFGLPQQVWIQTSTSSSPSTSWLKRVDEEVDALVVLGDVRGDEVERGSSIWITLQPAAASSRSSWFIAVAMSHISWRLSSS